jgi:streptogramin lyase
MPSEGDRLRRVIASRHETARPPQRSGSSAGGAVWVNNPTDGTVIRINPKSGRVAATIRASSSGNHLAGAGNSVWVAGSDNAVRRIAA